MRKKTKSLLSLLLALVMVLGICAVPAAAENSEIKYHYYVTLGDSITAGAPDYDPYAENVWVGGKYPLLVKTAVQAENGFQGGRCGWRSNELRIILDDTYTGDDFTLNFLPQWGVQNQYDLIQARERYREQIKKADLITIAIGGNDLLGNTTYVSRTISARVASTNPFYALFDAAISALSVSGFQAIAGLFSSAEKIGILPQLLTEVTQAMQKGVSDFKENFDVIIPKIRELNPTADIVCVGTYTNPSGEYGELGVTLSQTYVDEINNYIKSGSPYHTQYAFADVSGIDMTAGHTPDGHHPDAAGHQLIANQILSALSRIKQRDVFVERLYRVCLDREATQEEIDFHVWNLSTQGKTGIDVAATFVFSDEFSLKNYCDRHFTIKLYETLMGRMPEEAEIENWIWRMQQGASREAVFNEFATSAEFEEICASSEIERGEPIPAIGKGTKPGGYCSVEGCMASLPVALFAQRLYQVCLDRVPSQEETDAWHFNLVHGDYTATSAAKYFLFSPEFIAKDYDAEEYVLHLYAALMGRKPANDELTYWVSQISDYGMTRQAVFDLFANSDEFKVICSQFSVVHS